MRRARSRDWLSLAAVVATVWLMLAAIAEAQRSAQSGGEPEVTPYDGELEVEGDPTAIFKMREGDPGSLIRVR